MGDVAVMWFRRPGAQWLRRPLQGLLALLPGLARARLAGPGLLAALGGEFDPDGAYVRRYVPELGHLGGKAAHTPWDTANGYARGYPARIVDHAEERVEALARLAEITRPSSS